MEAIQLFLTIVLNGSYTECCKKITEVLKPFSTGEIQSNGTSNINEAQLTLELDPAKSRIEEIEFLIQENKAVITEINIHLLSGISGVSDPYGASGISIKIDDNLLKIDGVSGAAVSSTGTIKVNLNPRFKNKHTIIDEILKAISSVRSGEI